MIRATLLILVLICMIGISYWLGFSRGPERVVKVPVPVAQPQTRPDTGAAGGAGSAVAPETREQLQARLAIEQQRLERLQRTLADVTAGTVQPPTGSTDTHIQDISARVADLEQQISSLEQESIAVQENALVYKQTELVARNQRQLEIQSQVEGLTAQIADLQAANPGGDQSQLLALRARRDLLLSQLGTAKAEEDRMVSMVNSQQAMSAAQVRSDRLDVERRLTDLRAELAYWQSQRGATGNAPTLRSERAAQLTEEIRLQEERVEQLRGQADRFTR